MIETSCGYFDAYQRPFFIRDAIADLKNIDFDTMVGRGMSGVLAISKLSDAMHKHALYIRKPNDNSHAGGWGEGVLGERWIFVDDFIASGNTFLQVEEAVQNIFSDYSNIHTQNEPPLVTHFVGAYLYQEHLFTPHRIDLLWGDRYAVNSAIKRNIQSQGG